MGKTTSYSDSLLNLVFTGTTFAGVAQKAASPVTCIWASLHTAAMSTTCTQASNESTYVGYSRIPITRGAAGWSVTNNTVSPANTITFPAATGGAETETAFGLGLSPTGAGVLLYFGGISPGIPVVNGTQPELLATSTITET